MDINKLKEKAILLLEISSSLGLGYEKIGDDYMFWGVYEAQLIGSQRLVFLNGDLNNYFYLKHNRCASKKNGIEGDFKIELSNESKKNKLLITNILFEYCDISKVQLFKMLSLEDYLVLHFEQPFSVTRKLKKNGIDFNIERHTVDSIVIDNVVIDNLQREIVYYVKGSLKVGGILTIRGQVSNEYFKKIGEEELIDGYEVVSKKSNFSKNGDTIALDRAYCSIEIVLKKI